MPVSIYLPVVVVVVSIVVYLLSRSSTPPLPGTLTAGKMTARRLWFHGDEYGFTGAGYDPTGNLEARTVDDDYVKDLAADPNRVMFGPHSLPVWLAVLCRWASARVCTVCFLLCPDSMVWAATPSCSGWSRPTRKPNRSSRAAGSVWAT